MHGRCKGGTVISTVPRARRGDVYENPVTGERAVVRVGTDETQGERLVVDLYVRPRGAVAAEHWHPGMREQFTVVSGSIAFSINGKQTFAEPGKSIEIPPGVVHDWWNAGDDEAHAIVEIQPADRFLVFAGNLFGLARDGHTNAKGVPNLLQLALLAREFEDVVQFTRPPRAVQRLLFALLAPIARLCGYRGSYPEYSGT
jgi:quercetin dioxygenase-like cupin family protein